MITPVFEIDQEEEFVVVKLRAPHIKVQSFDFYVEGSTFKFFGHPYFLRLVFSSELVEDGREKASYDVDSGIVTVLLPKKVSLSSLYASLTLVRTKGRPSRIWTFSPSSSTLDKILKGDLNSLTALGVTFIGDLMVEEKLKLRGILDAVGSE